MTAREHEQLIDGLRGMLRGDGAGIDLDSPLQWVIESVREPIAFFRALPALLPAGAILYMEGISIAPDVAAFYERQKATKTVSVARDCISPVPEVFHVSFSPSVIDKLCTLAAKLPSAELFDHIKAYHDAKLIFTYHDAFLGQLRVSGQVRESIVQDFCARIGATYLQEATKHRDLEQVRRFLSVLENPDKMHSARLPIWKRLWHLVTR